MDLRHPSYRRKPVPTLWLMTDERMGDALWAALTALPRGSGIVFRHFMTAPRERAAITARVTRIARKRRLILIDSGTARQPVRLCPVHSMHEAVAARHAGADLVLVSPVFPTRTHPGARGLGAFQAATLARASGLPAIALGGMTQKRFRRLQKFGFVGWAAIDDLTPP